MSKHTKDTSIIKVVVIGEPCVGKSALIDRFIQNKFVQHYCPSIGTDFQSTTLKTEDKTFSIQLWTTSGQERFYSGSGIAFYRGSSGCVIVYDVTDTRSFQSLNSWYEDFVRKVDNDMEHVSVVVMGNKCDSEDRKVTRSDAQQWCDDRGLPYFETSAKDDTNVQDGFMAIVRYITGETELRKSSKESKEINIKIEPRKESFEESKKTDSIKAELYEVTHELAKEKKKMKVVVIGEPRVGKTALIDRFIHNKFVPLYRPSIAVDFESKTVETEDKIFSVQLWTTVSSGTGPKFYRGSDGCVMVYDVTDTRSFQSLNSWYEDLVKNVDDMEHVSVVVLGNKCDSEERKVARSNAQQWCDDRGLPYFETSAKDNTSVEEGFTALVKCTTGKNEPKKENSEESKKNHHKKELKKERTKLQLKLMVLGDVKVGKTSLVEKYTKDVFPYDYIPTIIVDFTTKTLQVDGNTVELQLWHASGQERFQSPCAAFLKGVDCFMIVYDVTRAETFRSIEYWINRGKLEAGLADLENMSFMVVGNKTDCKGREIMEEEAKHWCYQNGVLYGETSAKRGTNIDQAFLNLIKKSVL